MLDFLTGFLRARRHYHARFALSADYEVELWECPGAWLDDDSFDQLIEALRTVAAANAPGSAIPDYGPLRADRVEQGQRVVTLVRERSSGQPVAFNAIRYMDLEIGGRTNRVVHLGLTYVDPAYRKARLSHVLYGLANFFLFVRGGMRRFWVSNVTQVPTVVGLVAVHYDNVYPSPYPGTRQTFTHLQFARAIMARHRHAFGVASEAGFDEGRQVISNAYTGGSDELKKTFADAPKYKDPIVNDYCSRELDYDRGDDILQLGTWGWRTTVRFLSAKMPAGAFGRIVFRGLALIVASLFVPAARWLTEDRSLNRSTHD